MEPRTEFADFEYGKHLLKNMQEGFRPFTDTTSMLHSLIALATKLASLT
jgi:hypothetical protein